MLELATGWKQRLLDAIAQAAYEHSSEARVAQAAGLHPRFISQARRRGRIQLDQAFALIAALGKDPGTFVAHSLGGPTPQIETLDAPTPGLGPAAQELLERAHQRIDDSGPSTLPRSHLHHLDELRYGQPARVRELIERQIDFFAPEDIPFALGVWASSNRLMLDLESARAVLDAALDLIGDRVQERASILQRRAYVDLYRGAPSTARDLLDNAHDLMASEDRSKAGNVLIDIALVADHQGRTEEGYEMLIEAEQLVTSESPRSRLALLLNLLLARHRLGLPLEMEASMPEIREVSTRVQPEFSRKTDWTLGVIESDRDTARARERLWRYARYVQHSQPVAMAEVLIDLAVIELRQRQMSEVARLLEPLGHLLDVADPTVPEVPWSQREQWSRGDLETARKVLQSSVNRREIWRGRVLDLPR